MSLPFSLLSPHPSDIPPGAIPAWDRGVQASWERAGSWGRDGQPLPSFLSSAVIQDPKPRAAAEHSYYFHSNDQAGNGKLEEGVHLSPKAHKVVPMTQEMPLRCRLVERPSVTSGEAEGGHMP